MTSKIEKITFERFAGLMSGRIAAIHGANGTVLTFYKKGDVQSFIMTNRAGNKTTLDAHHTNEERLNAHFKGFQQNSK